MTISINSKNNRIRGILMASIGSVFWGASGNAAQYLMQVQGFDPAFLTEIRMICAGMLLLFISRITGTDSIWTIWKDRASRFRLIAFSLIGMLGVQYTYLAAIEASNAPTATIMQYMMPIIILIWVAIEQKHFPKAIEILCSLLAITGTALIVTSGDFTHLALSHAALFWGVATAFAAAFYTAQPRWLMQRWPATLIVGWGMLLGALPLCVYFPPFHPAGMVDISTFLAFAYFVVFGTAIAFWFYVGSTKYIMPQETSVLNALEPLSSIILSAVLLDTIFGIPELIGAVIIICPVLYISTHKS